IQQQAVPQPGGMAQQSVPRARGQQPMGAPRNQPGASQSVPTAPVADYNDPYAGFQQPGYGQPGYGQPGYPDAQKPRGGFGSWFGGLALWQKLVAGVLILLLIWVVLIAVPW